MKTDNRNNGENTISLIVGKITLLIYNIRDPDNPIELAFQKRYGPIVTYKWYGDGYILLGFEAGYLISISTHIKEVGQELLQIKNHRDSLNGISLSLTAKKVVTCGDNTLKIHSILSLEETEKIITVSGEAAVNSVEWSADGTMIAAVTHSGNVLIYLAQIPKLTSVCGNRIALLASLTEVIVYLYTLDNEKPEPQTINTIIEPSILSVGPMHVAVAVNNRGLYWNLSAGKTDRPIHIERDYLATVESICLNEIYTSVLFDGKIQLHSIKTDPNLIKEERDSKVFADHNSSDGKITCHALSSDFLIYGTDMGRIVYFYLDVFNNSSEYSHNSGIKNIYMDVNGTNICFIDDKNDIYLYNPVDEKIITVQDCPDSAEGIIWDQNIYESSIFAVYNKYIITTYIFVKYSIEGSKVVKITTTKLPSETIPLLMYGGEVTLGVAGGKLLKITLSSHEDVGNIVENKKIIEILDNQINCHRYQQAWNTCAILNEKNYWIKLGKNALENLDIEMGIRAYSKIPDVSMVWALQKLENVEELPLLCGHICVLLENYDKAEKFFIESSEPVEALYLRRDLMEWEQALNLAKKYKPQEIPFISQEYAQQLELTGNYPKALINYERGLSDVNEAAVPADQYYNHRIQCLSGIARTSIRCGDSRRGVGIAMENDTPRSVRKECAEILESMKQFNEAAILYEKADYFDKAALAYIKLKNWVKVGQLLPKISAPKINIQYAKAKEAEGKYDDAAKAYEIAKDYDNIIRINLEYLNNPGRSVEIVQQTKSIEGAKMVARYFQRMNDYNSAIKFLIMSNCHDEAFQLANQHGKMELYGDILVNTLDDDNIRLEDFKSLAIHFESQKNSLLAGKYYFYAKDFHKVCIFIFNCKCPSF